MAERIGKGPQPRNIDSLRPAELDQYYAVQGWRIRSRSIHGSKVEGDAFNQAVAKPLALVCREGNRGYDILSHWESDKTGRPSLPFLSNGFDMPSFLLEPLSEDEVKEAEKQGEADKLLRPDDIRKILKPIRTARRFLSTVIECAIPEIPKEKIIERLREALRENPNDQNLQHDLEELLNSDS